MFGKNFLIAITWLMLSGGLPVDSASIDSSESTSMESADVKEANDLKRYRIMEHNLFHSEEFSSSEYHDDDLDVEFDLMSNSTIASTDWDVLIFTQQWPVTTCYHWREEDKNHKCKLPSGQEFWTIHGVWPTKLGHMGPNFCNKSANFDIKVLQDIMSGMNNYWPDIDGDESTDEHWLWQHEWLKHGTCAATLEQLNNELKYFDQGLNWRQNYELSRILDRADIHPDSNNTVVALHTALVKGLGKNPSIHCVYDLKTETSFLAEIRICFNKSLELIDCDGVLSEAVLVDYPGGTVITNCHISEPVRYPSLVPPGHRSKAKAKEKGTWKFPIVNIYKLIQFIMWFTL